MSCERFHLLMMGMIDHELEAKERSELEEHVRHCRDCEAELEGFKRLEKRMRELRIVEPTDLEWERFWRGLYNRLERRIAWGLLIAGGAVTAGFAAFELARSERHPILKLGLLAMVAGAGLLFLSVLRARLRRSCASCP